MSMPKSTNQTMKSSRIQASLTLANTGQRSRENLGMPIERAADLAGMQISEWGALEAGWVPDTSVSCMPWLTHWK